MDDLALLQPSLLTFSAGHESDAKELLGLQQNHKAQALVFSFVFIGWVLSYSVSKLE